MVQVESRPFGVSRSGESVAEYIMTNSGGLEVRVLNLGCIIKNIIVPSRVGPVDVVLGHDTLQQYENDTATRCGAVIGRHAGRIENAEAEINGRVYRLTANDGNNFLHGDIDKHIFRVRVLGDTLLMETESQSGENGFPGNLKIAVRYTLSDDNSFRMDYRVVSDEDTIVNMTNHTYFNLDGGGTVLNQKLRLYASRYLEARDDICPTGRILDVKETPMDFLDGREIGGRIGENYEQLAIAGDGYDHCYVIDRAKGASQSICAWAVSEKTGISMKLYTTQPAVQFYTGNYLQDCPSPGKGGVPMEKYEGFALETQHFPCAPSHPEFPSVLLPAGKVYRSSTMLRFFTGKQCGTL